jgi:hypothetical protein
MFTTGQPTIYIKPVGLAAALRFVYVSRPQRTCGRSLRARIDKQDSLTEPKGKRFMSPVESALATLAGVIVLLLLILLAVSGGQLGRFGLAFKSFQRTLRDQAFAEKAQALLAPAEAKPKTPPKPSGAPLRLLGLLQREGRLLDFLLEDIQAYPDQQIGAAVRDIHRQCQSAIKEHLVLEPVLPQSEGAPIEVPPGFDPSAIRLTGNVTGQPPFKGTLQHHGWRVKELKLTAPAEGQDEFILMPAEVELP